MCEAFLLWLGATARADYSFLDAPATLARLLAGDLLSAYPPLLNGLLREANTLLRAVAQAGA